MPVTQQLQPKKNEHPVNEVLPIPAMLVYGLQHVLAMYAGAVAVPLILAHALHLNQNQLICLINADLFTCGIATVIQTLGFWKLGIRLPIVQGVTFAAISPMILIGKSLGLPAIYGAVIAAGIFAMLISPFFGKLIRFFPPIVTGTIITLIGISLMPVAVIWAGGGNPSSPDFSSASSIGLAFFVLCLIILFNHFLKGFLKSISVLLGLIAGTLLSIYLGHIQFDSIAQAPWIGLSLPFAFGYPTFDLTAIVSMTLVMVVSMSETMGDFIAISSIVEKPLTEEDAKRGLLADGFSTFLGGILNTFPYTAYVQNIGLIGLTQIKSRFVVATAGLILILLGLVPKIAALVAIVPSPVLGGAGMVMFGMVIVSGIRTLSQAHLEENYNALIVAISLAVGLIPLGASDFYRNFPNWIQVIFHSGITAGSLTAIILNLILQPKARKEKLSQLSTSETYV